MAQRIEADEKLLQKIKELYVDKKMTLRPLAVEITKFVGETKSVDFLTRVLKENGWYVYRNGQKISKDYKKTKVAKEGFNIVAKCKKTNKKFNGAENKSGALIIHIRKTYPELKIPDKRERSEYRVKNGKFWHELFFNIEEVKKQETIKCHYCEREFNDLYNVSGAYTTHMKEEHKINEEQHLINHPEDSVRFKTFMDAKKEREDLESSKDNHIICAICGDMMKFINPKHLNEHEISTEDYKKYYGETLSVRTKNLMIKNGQELGYLGAKIKGRTSIEVLAKKFIEQSGVEFEEQKVLDNKRFIFDFYLPKFDAYIEIDGDYYHGYDRDCEWNVGVVKNIVNDLRKSYCVKKLYRLVPGGRFTESNLHLVYDEKTLFDFLEKENKEIKSHRLFNLKEDDIIFSKKLCEKKTEHFKDANTATDIRFMMEKFYKPIEFDKFIDFNKRLTPESKLKAIFYDVFYDAKKFTTRSVVETFSDRKKLREVIEYQLGINDEKKFFDVTVKSIYRGMEVKTMSPVSILPIEQVSTIYNQYVKEGNVVFDPFAGWATRLLGMEDKIKDEGCIYIGYDSNEKLKSGYNKVKLLYFPENREQVSMNIGDSKINIKELEQKIDFIYTSPPFYNDEVYNSGQTIYNNIDEWSENLLIPVFENCYKYLKPHCFMVIDMKELYNDAIILSADLCGFDLVETKKYIVTKSHYNKKIKQQYSLIFKKR